MNVIEKLSRQKVEKLNDSRKGKIRLPDNEEFEMPEAPYSHMKYDEKKQNV